MKAKEKEHTEAIVLRKNGLTYNEILKKIPVAKSTLSLGLREVGLAKPQLQRISEKKRAAEQHGADAKRRIRVERTEGIYDTAREEIGNLSKRELRLVGATLYWAEGSKAKPHSASTGIDFGNTRSEEHT